MGKSSSRRKKRSKASSQARKRKGSKIRSRRRESKKLRRHFSEDDDSRSSTLGSSSYSSSSEDDRYRSKRSSFRTRKDVKSRKKKARKRSYSSESSGDSPHMIKRKGSKRKCEYEKKSKTYLKKKCRRDYSTSSTSRVSRSCSTCQSDSNDSSHEPELERHQSVCGKEERDERSSAKLGSVTKRSRYRLRSPPCGKCRDSSSYPSEEKVWAENNSRRLRSVIIVAERDNEEEGRELSKDEDKEEIIHICGEYPPSRSNDSNDVGNKWEEGYHSSCDEVEKMRLENDKGDDTALSDSGNTEHKESGNISDYDGSRFDGSKPSFDECGTVNTVKGDDLESILRQRALENLRSFRGGRRTGGRTTANQNDGSEGEVKQSSIPNSESVQTRPGMEHNNKVVDANCSKEDAAELVSSVETQTDKKVGVPVKGKDISCSSQIDKNMTDRNTCENKSASSKQIVAPIVHQRAIVGNSKDKAIASISMVHPELAAPALMRQLSKSSSTPKQALECEEPQANLLLSKTSLDETVAVTAPTVTQNGNNSNADVNNAGSSAASEPSLLKSVSVETGSDKLQDEANEGSQLEQKTMSVMRGGERVKVSYKVYIPKKASTLARRQLKR